jgi:hypothetical protein
MTSPALTPRKGREESYLAALLVGKPDIGSPSEMRQRRIYLPQQDSIYTYMARDDEVSQETLRQALSRGGG